jgi:GDP-L-fucose synthase
MNIKSSIYVAGHRGLVGSSLIRMLRHSGYKNIITRDHAELDLTRQSDVEAFFIVKKPEYVFLASAKVGGILANSTYKADFIYENIMIAANVVNVSFKYKVKKLLNLGSSCIYPKYAKQPLKEETILSGYLEPTNEPYAIAKISALKMCRYYNEQYGTNFISVMPTNLFGPNDNFNLETSHVLPALLRKFHLAKLLKNKNYEEIINDIQVQPLGYHTDNVDYFRDEIKIEKLLEKAGIHSDYVMVWGSGEVYREFLYVDDLADACVYLMKKYDYNDLGEIINIGTGYDIKIKDLAYMIKDETGFDGEIRFDFSKPDGTPKKLLDVSRIKSLGWKEKIKLREGIRKTYDWYNNAIKDKREATRSRTKQ